MHVQPVDRNISPMQVRLNFISFCSCYLMLGSRIVFLYVNNYNFPFSHVLFSFFWLKLNRNFCILLVYNEKNTAYIKYIFLILYLGLTGVQMFGLSHPSVVYLVEQLYGASYCRRYKFKYHRHEMVERELVSLDIHIITNLLFNWS